MKELGGKCVAKICVKVKVVGRSQEVKVT